MNIKSQSSTIRSYGTPSIFSGTNLWFIKNGYWYFKNYDSEQPDKNKGPAASGDFAPDSSATLFTGKGSFQRNLDLLNERINTIHKELSYWDLYKITDSVLNPENFPSVISGLAVGCSAVINCEKFTYMDVIYRRGDVVVKISDNNELLIPAINTGVFQPQSPLQQIGGGYNLTFHYIEDARPGDQVILEGLTIATEGNAIYGQSFELNATGTNYINAENFGTSTTKIKPVVKTFIKDGIGYEEIVLDKDFTVELVTSTTPNKWKMTLKDKPNNNILIQVK